MLAHRLARAAAPLRATVAPLRAVHRPPVAAATRPLGTAAPKQAWGPPQAPASDRLPRGCLTGSVVSTSMDKTVAVDVTRTKIVPKYNKRRKYSRKFLAHDESEACGLGDVVRISPCRPLSRRKHFVVQEILKKGDGL